MSTRISSTSSLLDIDLSTLDPVVADTGTDSTGTGDPPVDPVVETTDAPSSGDPMDVTPTVDDGADDPANVDPEVVVATGGTLDPEAPPANDPDASGDTTPPSSTPPAPTADDGPDATTLLRHMRAGAPASFGRGDEATSIATATEQAEDDDTPANATGDQTDTTPVAEAPPANAPVDTGAEPPAPPPANAPSLSSMFFPESFVGGTGTGYGTADQVTIEPVALDDGLGDLAIPLIGADADQIVTGGDVGSAPVGIVEALHDIGAGSVPALPLETLMT